MSLFLKIPGPILVFLGAFSLSFGGLIVKSFEGATLWQILFWRSVFFLIVVGFFILITHIVLAAIIVPLALITLYRGWSENLSKHRKIAKITLPIWLYVSVTGVVIYMMLY